MDELGLADEPVPTREVETDDDADERQAA